MQLSFVICAFMHQALNMRNAMKLFKNLPKAERCTCQKEK